MNSDKLTLRNFLLWIRSFGFGESLAIIGVTYSILSAAYAYGVVFGVAVELTNLLTLTDFYRIALSHFSFLISAIVLGVPMLALGLLNPERQTRGEDISGEGSERPRRNFLRIMIAFLALLIFIALMVIQTFYLEDVIKYLGAENPLGNMFLAGGFMPFLAAPMISCFFIIFFRPPISLRCSLIFMNVAYFLFILGNLVGIHEARNASGWPCAVSDKKCLPIILVLDDFIIVKEDSSIFALEKSRDIKLKISTK
ncbi:hypothetical protein [Pontixanthobacter gangjinensis]|uniref:Uncharacterized protein n=1 Tax=Pontixanthobacter gangjinensis TaxID=1028742 RepID=A0A6I4SJE6_9SPHN|nr:hypothetical protein [Pontixanthobacter gangjinensis]MXO55991.1 hypothetical protein [Pontixanthobacter gangjinensis]